MTKLRDCLNEIKYEFQTREQTWKSLQKQPKFKKALTDITREVVIAFGGVDKDVPGMEKVVKEYIEKMIDKRLS